MIGNIKNKLSATYQKVVSSIAFYPSFILVGFIVLAGTMLSVEDQKMTKFLLDKAPFLVINNADTARALLATLIGGLLSLMVFSFSMVMMILNQASSNFSPRLLPGLVSDKWNQIVLGTYLGTIVYNILILMSVLPDGNKYTLNGLSILLGIILAMVCLILFIYFIHTISNGIQINNILNKIFDQTKKRINYLLDKKRQKTDIPQISDDEWHFIKSTDAGFYQGINLNGLLDYCDENEVHIKIIPHKGDYQLPRTDMFAITKNLSEEEAESLREYFIYASSHDVSDNHVLGIRQITEVGVKAMSPGINDPGTAAITIDYLTELIALRMRLNEREVYQKDEGKYTLQMRSVPFKKLMHDLLAAYRQYCKHDIILMEKIISMLLYLIDQKVQSEDYYTILKKELHIVKEDIEKNINNTADKNSLLDSIGDDLLEIETEQS